MHEHLKFHSFKFGESRFNSRFKILDPKEGTEPSEDLEKPLNKHAVQLRGSFPIERQLEFDKRGLTITQELRLAQVNLRPRPNCLFTWALKEP